MYEVSRDLCFSAAHQLRGYGGKCEGLHGHNWRIRVTVQGETLDKIGLLVDFKELKRCMEEVLDKLDHRMLNEVPPFDTENPSAERIARYVAQGVHRLLSDERVSVHRCEVWESEGSRATFFISGR